MVFENIIPIFMTCIDANHIPFVSENIFDVLQRIIGERCGITFEEKKINELASAPLVDALEKHQKYLMLIIDEFDLFYQLDYEYYSNASLKSFPLFGDDTSGRMSCILCGSSSNLESLIRTNNTDFLIKEFPLLRSPTNLNSSKFKTNRIYSGSPNDLDFVKSTLSMFVKNKMVEEQQAKIVMFFAGANPRRIYSLKDLNTTTVYVADHSYGNYNTLKDENIVRLKSSFIRELCTKNKELLSRLLVNGSYNEQEIKSGKWNVDFQPLKYEEARKIFQEQNSKPGLELNELLFHLSDHSYLELFGIQNGSPEYIYPPCVNDLIIFQTSNESLLTEMKTITLSLLEEVLKSDMDSKYHPLINSCLQILRSPVFGSKAAILIVLAILFFMYRYFRTGSQGLNQGAVKSSQNVTQVKSNL